MLNEDQIKTLQQVADGRRSFGPEDTTMGESELEPLKRFQPIAEKIIELGDDHYLENVKPNRESSTAYSYIDLIIVKGITAKGRRALEEARGRRRLFALKKIYDRVGDSITAGIGFSEFVSVTGLMPDEGRATLSYLNEKGYLGGHGDAGLSHAGIVEAERIITDRQRATDILGSQSSEDLLLVRERESRRFRVLRRLYDMSRANVDRGVPYDKLQEAEGLDENQWWAVHDYLKAERLIKEIANLHITELGIDEIERSKESPQSSTAHFSGVVIQNYYGNVGAVQSGSHSTAYVSQQNSHAELVSLLEKLRYALEAAPETPEKSDALEQFEMLKEEAQLEQPRPGRIKSCVSAIGAFVRDVSVDVASSAITKFVEHPPPF